MITLSTSIKRDLTGTGSGHALPFEKRKSTFFLLNRAAGKLKKDYVDVGSLPYIDIYRILIRLHISNVNKIYKIMVTN